jgi:hypothetical protein
MQVKDCFNSDYDFWVRLEYGQEGERLLKELLRTDEGGVKNETKVEVKRDRKARKTKNLAIETQSNSHDSGINVTKADWWAQIIENSDDGSKRPLGIIIVDVNHLKRVAARMRDVGKKVKAENGNNVILVPISELF